MTDKAENKESPPRLVAMLFDDANKAEFLQLSAREIGRRLVMAATLTTVTCVPLALFFLFVTGVPLSYPPLRPQQIIAGTFGGAVLTALGYSILNAIFINVKVRHTIFIAMGVLLLLASYYLPYRLTYSTSPRFTGWTFPALIAQGVLHTLVVIGCIACFLMRSGNEILAKLRI